MFDPYIEMILKRICKMLYHSTELCILWWEIMYIVQLFHSCLSWSNKIDKQQQPYSLSHPENDCDVTDRDVTDPRIHTCKTHPLCVNLSVPFWTCEKTHKLHARWQACSSGVRADVTVVLEVRQSIEHKRTQHYTCLHSHSSQEPFFRTKNGSQYVENVIF